MIYIIDDFLPEWMLDDIKSNLTNNNFVEHVVGDKPFYTQPSNPVIDKYILDKLGKIEGKELQNILSFFRVSTDKLDTNWRIHSDLIIKGEKPDRAVVLYISPKESKELHGTALWEHKVYGKRLPDETTNEEFDKMITKEAENLDMRTLNTVLGYEQNRLLSYPSSYFHSKYPNKSWKNGRQIFVMFYKFKIK